MKATKANCDKWEAAWTEYVERLEACENTRRDKSRYSMSGHTLQYKSNRHHLRKAIERLRKMDAQFCDLLGIV